MAPSFFTESLSVNHINCHDGGHSNLIPFKEISRLEEFNCKHTTLIFFLCNVFSVCGFRFFTADPLKKMKWWMYISTYVILHQSCCFFGGSHLHCGRSTGPGQSSEVEPCAQVDYFEWECLTFLFHSCWVYLPPFPLPLTSFHHPCRWQRGPSGCFCILGWW